MQTVGPKRQGPGLECIGFRADGVCRVYRDPISSPEAIHPPWPRSNPLDLVLAPRRRKIA